MINRFRDMAAHIRKLLFLLFTALVCIPLTHAAPGDTCTPPPSGMVSWWPGDGNANDIAGSNNGTFAANTYATGRVGQALSLSGNSHVVLGNPAALKIGGSLTIDAWINPSSVPADSDFHNILAKFTQTGGCSSGSAAYSFGLINEGGANKLNAWLQTTSGGLHNIRAGNVPTGSFSHVAVTYDAANGVVRLYVNGAQIAMNTTTAGGMCAASNAPVFIGGEANAVGAGASFRFFSGLIDEVEVFDRALSDVEIQTIYEAGSMGKCKNQSCATPPPNMVSWYRAENNALDAQGANDGTPSGGVGFAAGKVGQAFDFDGIDDNVSLGNPASLQFSGAITVDAWVRPDNDSGFKYTIAKWQAGGSQSSWLLAINGAAPRIFVLGNGGPGGTFTEIQGSPIPTGLSAAFTHVAMTYSATDILRLYVNGVQVGTGANVGTIANTGIKDVHIGSAVATPGNEFFDGLIDEVEIFDRVLTATEIKEIHDAGANGKCVEANLDFGDAPDPYPTLLADDGARHSATGPLLGTERDSESDGQPTAAADGDGEDEDGIATPIVLAEGKDSFVTATISDAGEGAFLNLWIDLDNDGSWAEAGDQILLDQPLTTGTHTVVVPAAATQDKPLGTYYGRLRICSATESCSSPTGAADDGEVEDYDVTLAKKQPAGSGGGSSNGGGGGGGLLALDPLLLAMMGLLGLWGLRRQRG